MFKHVVLALLAFACTAAVSANDMVERAVRSETAEEAIELATNEVLNLINAGKDYAEDDPERFYSEVEALLRPLIDFPRFARNVMGPYYRTASAEQRTRFADSFKWSLVRTYALALLQFGEGDVEVQPPRQPPRNPDKVNVTQQITYEGKAYIVVYRMQRSKEQTWRLQNLVVEGVNVGLNYKSQFAAAMKDPQYAGDLDAVINSWTDLIEAEQEAEQEQTETAAVST